MRFGTCWPAACALSLLTTAVVCVLWPDNVFTSRSMQSFQFLCKCKLSCNATLLLKTSSLQGHANVTHVTLCAGSAAFRNRIDLHKEDIHVQPRDLLLLPIFVCNGDQLACLSHCVVFSCLMIRVHGSLVTQLPVWHAPVPHRVIQELTCPAQSQSIVSSVNCWTNTIFLVPSLSCH